MSDQFYDGLYLDASQKLKIYKKLERVFETLDEKFFSQALYQHLSCHCGFIAHFDKSGFWQKRFEDPMGLIMTMDGLTSMPNYQISKDHPSKIGDLNEQIKLLAQKYYDQVVKIADERKYADLEDTIKRSEAHRQKIAAKYNS